MPNTDHSSQASNPNTLSTIEAEPLPELVGTFDDVARFQGAAGAFSLAEVRPCRIDVRLAAFNAMAGRAAILGARAELEAIRHPIDWSRIESIDSLCRGIAYLVTRSGAYPPPSGEVLALLQEGRPLRRLLLSSATTQSLAGRCPAAEVARIARGRGALDTAVDLVDLAFVHTQHGLTGGNASVTDAQVARAKVIGAALQRLIRPHGAPPPPRSSGHIDVIALRDRLWTVLLGVHADMERAAGALWGSQLRKHVPPLRSRYVPRTKKPKAPVAPTG